MSSRNKTRKHVVVSANKMIRVRLTVDKKIESYETKPSCRHLYVYAALTGGHSYNVFPFDECVFREMQQYRPVPPAKMRESYQFFEDFSAAGIYRFYSGFGWFVRKIVYTPDAGKWRI